MECGHATQAAAINEGMQGRVGAAAEAAAQIRFDDGVSRGETNRTSPRPARAPATPVFIEEDKTGVNRSYLRKCSFFFNVLWVTGQGAW